MKRHLTFAALVLIPLLSVCSCSETGEFDDHADWQARNISFMNAWADSCDTWIGKGVSVDNAVEGQMFRLLSFKLDPAKEWDRASDYIYCRILAKGDGTGSPMYTDSVRINYRVRLMPSTYYPDGQVMDQSYKTDQMDPNVNIPSSYAVSGLIEGMSTALLHMKTGDRWMIYIPYQLAYGTKDSNSFPAYSALVFEVNLTEFARTGQELSRQ